MGASAPTDFGGQGARKRRVDMHHIDRRRFMKTALAVPALSTITVHGGYAADEGAPPASETSGLPRGTIGDLEISRLLLGGNLLTHYTHSRDLDYVYTLAEHYNTREKILETLALAEEHGVNTLVIHTVDSALEILHEHRRNGGKMKWIICPTTPIEPGLAQYEDHVKRMVDDGVDALYIWGVHADPMARDGQIDLMGQAVDMVKAQGVPCGVGGHTLQVLRECEWSQVRTDFYIKTLHHLDYPTAPAPDETADDTAEIPGYWCGKPGETIEFMETIEKPVIAFKVMAAGAIPPENAFRYAFTNGADFVLAGMFDFEIAENVNIAQSVLAEPEVKDRDRPWRA